MTKTQTRSGLAKLLKAELGHRITATRTDGELIEGREYGFVRVVGKRSKEIEPIIQKRKIKEDYVEVAFIPSTAEEVYVEVMDKHSNTLHVHYSLFKEFQDN